MKIIKHFYSLVASVIAVTALVVLTGCSGIPVLQEQEDYVIDIDSYRAPSLALLNPRYVVAFDYLGCVDRAVVSSVGFTGNTSVTGLLDMRRIIEREFEAAAEANFSPVMAGKKIDGVVHVETERLIISEVSSGYSAEIDLDIDAIALTTAGRQRVFRKKYRASAQSQDDDDGKVPHCVYACVSQIVKQFVNDLSNNQDIAESIQNQSQNKK